MNTPNQERDIGAEARTNEVSSKRPRIFWVLVGFLAISAFFLIIEHRAHLLGYWPFLFLAACAVMHLFMHRGHGHHGIGSDDPRDKES